MKLYIKNMVCPRCIMAVERELQELRLPAKHVELGIAEFESTLTQQQVASINSRLLPLGFVLLNDTKHKQVEQIKYLLIGLLQQGGIEPHFSVKKFLSANISKEYSYLSKMFSEKEGITIENYFILLKLEKVKELITYGEETLNEIAWRLGYSSVQHLSSQFKRVLGMSTTSFKTSLTEKRKSIDGIGAKAT